MKHTPMFLRNGQYYVRKRVPRRYRVIEPRTILNICLFTDSKQIAETKFKAMWAELIEAWEAKLAGKTTEGEARLTAARELAHRRGFRYLDTSTVSQLPLADVLKRVLEVQNKHGQIDMKVADATLGTGKSSTVTVTEAFDAFYDVAADRLAGKSEDQIRRHRNPRLKATRNFVSAVGDRPLAELTAEDMFQFRKWLHQRVATGELTADSANKDMVYLLAMWKPVAQSRGFKLPFETDGLLLKVSKNSKARTRPPFSEKWIREKLLAPGALGGLNDDARLIVLGMINTGYRPSEGAGLTREDIILDANMPHIVIRPNENRSLKNDASERIIPLCGVSLEAFRQAREGFPRYASDSATLSATVNKFLFTNGLLETDKHSLYSLRHSMEDRMLRAGIDERIRKDVLGHQINRERYGEGGGLEHVHKLLQTIAL